MATLELNQDEQEVLSATLESYLSDLRLEIADTENHDFREQLKHREEVLKKILATLQG